jgi:NAD(P)-dependent dehydrogenase (short-subunit alcohol dehydrogenase family)
MVGRLQGKRALITGASKGIGAAVALAFAREGAHLVLASRTRADLDAVAAEARAYGVDATVCPTDVGDKDEVKRLAQEALSAFGGLDILVNNAFLPTALKPFLDMEEDLWDRIQATNFRSAIYLLQTVGRSFVEQRSGNVINMSSIRGLNGVPMGSGYATTKAALNSITKTLACEWGPANVRVNAILPGPTLTDSVQQALNHDPALIRYFADIKPLKGWIEAADVAEPAVFLASEAARMISGHLLVVDGGLTAILQDTFAHTRSHLVD